MRFGGGGGGAFFLAGGGSGGGRGGGGTQRAGFSASNARLGAVTGCGRVGGRTWFEKRVLR